METKEQFLARYYAAAEAGASKAELQAMIDEFQAMAAAAPQGDSKKKEETSPLEPVSEVDFTDSSSGLATPAQQDGDDSGASASTPVTFDPYQTYDFGGQQIPGADAQLVYNYGQAYEQSRSQWINENFDLAQYYGQNNMAADAARLESLSPEQLELEKQSVIQGIEQLAKDNSNQAYKEYGKGIKDTEIPEANKQNLAEFQQAPAMDIWASRAGVEQMTGVSTRLFEEQIEGLGLTEEQVAEEYKEYVIDRLDKTSNNNIFSYINSKVEPLATERFRQSLNRDLTIDERRSIEQNLYRNYDISTDLTGEGYVNESGQGWLGVTDVFSPGFKRSGLAIWDGVATAVENVFGGNEEAQAERQQAIKDIGKEMSVSTRSMGEKWDDGDITGWMTDGLGMLGQSAPLMGAAMLTGAVSRGNVRAVASVTSTLGAATIYSENKDTEWFDNLSSAEALGFVVSSGIAEGLPAAVGGNIFRTGGMLAKGLARTLGTEAGEQGFKQWTKGLLVGAGLGAVEEGITEGITAGWQYTSRINAMQAAGENVQWNYDEFWKQTKEGAVAGIAMGGTLAPAGNVVRTVASKGLDLIRTKAKIDELKQQFSQAESKSERATIGRKIVDAVDAYTKLSDRRQQLMEYLAETKPETYERLVEIHNRVEVLAEQYTRADSDARRKITKEVRELMAERGNIEGEMDSMLQTDGKLESRILAREGRKAGKKRRNYGGLFAEGRGKVTVTADNLGPIAKIIQGLTKYDVSPHTVVDGEGKTKAVTTGERIVRGMQNAVNVVKGLSSLGDVAVDMYRDYDTYIEDLMQEAGLTREAAVEAAGRGMWTGSGQIKMFLPGLLETTAYHEGYHDFVLQTIGTKAAVGLAKKLFQALPDNLTKRYSQFLTSYGDGRGSLTSSLDDKSLTEEQKVQVADEFLTELLADITAGNVSIDIQKSVVRQFMDFLSPHLGRIGVKGIPDAKIDNVVSAIQQMTQEFSEGRRLEGQRRLNEAVIRANYAGIAMRAGVMMDDDAEDGFDKTKTQMVYRAGNLVDKAEPAAKMRGRRSTGHFGTGFYFFSDEKRAIEYAKPDNREVSQLNIADYNLARATKGLHEVLKDINNASDASEAHWSGGDYRFIPYTFVRVGSVLGEFVTEEQAREMADRAQKIFDKQRSIPVERYRERDSISTIVMKAMGYEGVSAVDTDLDNSTYGTVIYDIKKGAEPKAQAMEAGGGEIFATIVFSVSVSGKAKHPVKKVFKDERHLNNFIKFMERERGWTYEETYVHSGEYSGEATKQKSEPIRETVDATDRDILYKADPQGIKDFARSMDRAMKMMADRGVNIGLQVTQLSEADVQKIVDEGGVIFMTADVGAGGYITKDGYVGGIFKNPDTRYKRITKPLFKRMEQWAERNGVEIFFDAFATKLEDIYIGLGYKPYARTAFNREFAPEGWDAENSPLLDEPDVVFFVKGEGTKGEGQRFDDYMQAFDATAARAKKPKAQALPNPELQENAQVSIEEATGISPQQREQRRAEIKLPESQRQRRNNTILDVLNKYELGEITQEDYLRAVRENMPIKPFEAVPEIPTVLDIASALDANKVDKGIVGVNKEIEDGYYVGLRLDIPAYDNYDTWVVSVHQGKKAEPRSPFLGGKAIGYGQTAVITNATFDSTPTAALNIARGTAKTTIARMFGDWRNENPETTRQRAVDIMAGPEYNSDYKEIGKMEGWVQVGMNPFRHSWFYDKRDGRPLAEASEIIQIGALVLAKDAVKVSESDPRFEAKSKVGGGRIKFQRPGSLVADPVSLVKSQKIGIFDLNYTASTTQMEDWLKSGVVRQEDMSILEGRPVLSHSPDNMMVGSVSVDGRVLVNNGGGLFYSANTGDVWAVAGESAGNNMANELNELLKTSPDGKAYLLLISGGREKHRSSTNGVMSMASLGFELVNQNVLTKTELKKVLKETIAETERLSIAAQIRRNEARVKDGKEPNPIKRGTNKLSSMSGTMEALFERFFVEFASPYKSTFEQRREFVDKFATNVGKAVAVKARESAAKKKELIAAYERIFEFRPKASQFGSTLKNFFFDYFQEKVLQGGQPNEIYGAIEVSSEVRLEKDPNPTASYPLKLVNVDPNAPTPKTIVFKTMRSAAGTLVTRGTNPANRGLEIGDMYINSKGERKLITPNAFEMMGGMGQATWGRMSVKAPVPIDTITRDILNMEESKPIGVRAKSQGNLMKLIADMVDPSIPTPSARVTKRGKLIIAPSKTELWNKRKKEVVDLLVASGMSKENAQALYANAKAYKEGRTAGRKLATKEAQSTLGKRNRELSTEAKALRKELDQLKNKAKTVEEFLSFAIKLVDERMKGKGQQPFGNADIQRLLKIVRQAHKSSAKRIEKEGGAEVMDTFIEKLIDIFDKQDAKAAMRDYLASISAARKLQKRLSTITKKRKKGEALKSVASYAKVLSRLADINPALLSPTDVKDFINTLNSAVQTVSKVKTSFDPEEQRIVAEAPARRSVETLSALADKFKAMEELGRNAVMVAKAKALAEKNGTTFEEEYSALLKAEGLRKVSGTRKAILKFIEDNPNLGLDPANPADVEYVLQQLAENKALLEEQSKEAIITDVLLPQIAFNLDKLLEDRHIAEILGLYDATKFNVSELVSRLNKLDKIHLANLEFKLDDYLMNDSVMGLGYLASRVRGRIEMADAIKGELTSKGIKAGTRPILSLLDTADSFLRLVFKTDNKTIAKIRRLIGFADMERAFAKADMIHAMTVEAISEEIDRIEKEGGSVRTITDNAIMQLFSMARQMPVLEEGAPGQNEAEWYLALRDAMRRSIAHYRDQRELYSDEDIAQMEAAFEYLFSEKNLPNLIAKVQTERPDLVQMVDFMAGVHSTLEDSFANYVERYLGKNLTRENNYTPFSVKVKVKNEAVDEGLQMRQAIMDSMRSSSLSNAKKVAGSSYERNPKSITGSNNIIGLDFTKINERTLRENTILSNTVGEVMALQSVFSSDEMSELIADDGVRQQLHSKLMQYITQDAGRAPFVFQSRFMVGSKKFRNPIKTIRNAVIVKAFGGVLTQTLKQSTVLISTMANTKNPVQSIPYMIQTVGELFAFAVRNGLFTDSKIALDANGRYKLLQNSPVFSRDYEAGNIDPYTGAIDTETSWFVRTRDKLNDLALQNLKSTDKVAAIASWFTFYGDYLISEGFADSFDDINWEEQAARPDLDALSYADSMVTKDQAASTPRQAADIYKDTAGTMSAVVAMVRNIILPFARFAVNKKRSVYSDFEKIRTGTAVKEGTVAMAGHMAELATFHAIGKILIPAIASMFVDDEEKESEYRKNPWLDIAGSMLADMNPLPPLGYLEDVVKEMANKYMLFPLSEGLDGVPSFLEGEDYDDRYERWKNTSATIPTYSSSPELSASGLLKVAMGPYGEFVTDAGNTVRNLMEGGNKVYSSTGKEYFVRPEDKDQMDMFFAMKFLMAMGQMAGFSSKEIDILARRLDDMPRERSFGSEEELAAYETIARSVLAEDRDFLATLEDGSGIERFQRILIEKLNYSPFDAEKAASKFQKGAKAAAVELSMREMDGYAQHIRDIRIIFKNAGDAKDYFAMVNNRKNSMDAAEFAEFKSLADLYMAGMRSGTLEESMFYNLTE